MEHSLHLSAKYFVQTVAPSSPRKIAKKIERALQNAQIDGEVNLDTLGDKLAGFLFDDGDNDAGEDGEDEDNTTDLDAGDCLGKALAHVLACPKDCRAHALSDTGIASSTRFFQILMCTSRGPYSRASSLDPNPLGFALPAP
jgi:hypothetical protein